MNSANVQLLEKIEKLKEKNIHLTQQAQANQHSDENATPHPEAEQRLTPHLNKAKEKHKHTQHFRHSLPNEKKSLLFTAGLKCRLKNVGR